MEKEIKVGDKIKIIANYCFGSEADEMIGKTYTVKKIYDAGVDIYILGDFHYWTFREIELMEKTFSTKDLKDKHILKLSGGQYILASEIFDDIEYYDNNLEHKTDRRADIIEIWEFDKLVWKKEIEILDKEEKEYLSIIVKPFKSKIVSIAKRRSQGIENVDFVDLDYITIKLRGITGIESIDLPYFKSELMYSGMSLNEKYTLEDLGL